MNDEYYIQCKDLFGNWIDAEWMENYKPLRFTSIKDANKAIDQFIAESKSAYDKGFLNDSFDRDEYRAVKITNNK